jgi:hypothetical protein
VYILEKQCTEQIITLFWFRYKPIQAITITKTNDDRKKVTISEWLQMDFGLVTGFIEHLQIINTSNYTAIANSHTLQFTTASTTSSQSAVSPPVDIPLLPVSCPHRLATISNQPPTILTSTDSPCYIVSTWTHRKHHFQQLLHCCTLHSCYIAMAVSLAP